MKKISVYLPLMLVGFSHSGGVLAETIESESDPSLMPTVVVSATGYQQDLLRAPASLTVIDKEQLQSQPASDLAEVFRDIPGITLVDSAAPGMKRISLRGESARRVLIKINGQPLSDHTNYGTPLLIDVAMIERIEVVRGSASVVHGSNAIGGVVSITTRRMTPGQHETILGAGYYSATEGYRVAAGTQGGTESVDWRLQSSKITHGDRETPRGTLAGTDSEQQSVSAELGFRPTAGHHISWQGDYFTAEAGAWVDPSSGVDLLRFPERESIRNALSWEYADDTGWLRRVSTRAYHHKGKRVMDNAITTLTPPLAPIQRINVKNNSDDDLLTQGLQSTLEGHFWADNATVFGLEYQEEELDTHKLTTTTQTVLATNTTTVLPPKTSDQLAKQGFLSGFLQQQIKLADSLEANIGARYYNIRSQLLRSTERSPTKDTEKEYVGSASLIWQAQENTSYRVSIAQGYTYPSVTQQFAVTAGGRDIHFGNPNLASEKATTLELGFRHDSHDWLADITLYASKATDFIDRNQLTAAPAGYSGYTVPSGSQRFWEWVNVDKAFSYGLESNLAWQVNTFRPYLNMSAQRRKLEFGNAYSTYRSGLPIFQLRSGVEWEVLKNMTLDFYARSYGKSRREDNAAKQTDRTSGYVEMNMAMEYKPTAQWSVTAVARNIGNRYYQNPDELPAAGRALDIETQWRF